MLGNTRREWMRIGLRKARKTSSWPRRENILGTFSLWGHVQVHSHECTVDLGVFAQMATSVFYKNGLAMVLFPSWELRSIFAARPSPCTGRGSCECNEPATNQWFIFWKLSAVFFESLQLGLSVNPLGAFINTRAPNLTLQHKQQHTQQHLCTFLPRKVTQGPLKKKKKKTCFK